jgi:hypothetical protein
MGGFYNHHEEREENKPKLILLIREPLNKSMIGIQLPETANYFVAKLGNIPDIPCVLRLVFGCLRNLSARPGLIQRFLRKIGGICVSQDTDFRFIGLIDGS